MITRYKYMSDIPYSLHDMRISKIEQIDSTLKFYFEEGYVHCQEPCLQVNGSLSIEEVDYDFCFVYLLSNNGDMGDFKGKKFELLDFLKDYNEFSFEVIDESYGYNSVTYNGYLILPKKNDMVEMTLSIYHFGDIVYETEE